MPRFVWIPILIIALTMSANDMVGQGHSQMTARAYYDELYKAGGLDNFTDQYACFRDDDVPTFFIMAKSDGMRDLFESTGEMKKLPPEQQSAMKKGFLLKTSYNKGLPNGMEFLNPGSDGGSYREDFDLPGQHGTKATPIRLSLRISWETLRYKITLSERGKPVVLAEDTGKCEVVKGDIQQHGHHEK